MRADPPVTRMLQPAVLGAAVGLFAAVFLIAGLADYGLWSDAELPVVDRSRAALGEPLSGLIRSPWLPDALRTAGLRLSQWAWGDVWGVRLPHAIAGAGLAGLATALAAWRGARPLAAVAAGGLVLSFPGLAQASRTVVGNPIGELLATATVILGWHLLKGPSTADGPAIRPAPIAVLGLMLTASVATSGLLLGGALPLTALALAAPPRAGRRLETGLWTAALVTSGIAVLLAVRQHDGYIPILGASKALELLDGNRTRPFTAVLEDLGMQTFPWLPLAGVGILLPGSGPDRWPAKWLIAGLVMAGGWGVVYGSMHLPLAVPTALCALQGLQILGDSDRPAVLRRFGLALALCGILVLGKDAQRTPSRVGSPLHAFLGEHVYPDAALGTSTWMKVSERIALLLTLGVGLLGTRRREPAPGSLGPPVVGAVVAAGLVVQSTLVVHVILPGTADSHSLARPLRRHAEWAEQGILPPELMALRVRNRGIDYYGPPETQRTETNNRMQLIERLAGPDPAVALVRNNDLPGLFQSHRARDWPLYVLDATHANLSLIANTLPDGAEDHNPLREVVLDEVPSLANETLVRFDDVLELVGWEVQEPLVRGDEARLRLAFRVLRTPPSSIQVHARFQRGRTSRFNWEDHKLTDGLYPPRNWRSGDIILHEQVFPVPALEIVSGSHDFVVAIPRGEHDHLKITVPEDKEGEFGVVLRGTSRNFARLGFVDVL